MAAGRQITVSIRTLWALWISVVVNLFLIAAAIGAAIVIHAHLSEFRRPMPAAAAWHQATKNLSDVSRQNLYTLIKTSALSGEDDMLKARTLRMQAAQLANQTPYDAVRIMALSEQARGLENDARAKVEVALIGGMANMAPAEREVVASQLLRPSFHFRFFADQDEKSKAQAHPPAGPPAP